MLQILRFEYFVYFCVLHALCSFLQQSNTRKCIKIDNVLEIIAQTVKCNYKIISFTVCHSKFYYESAILNFQRVFYKYLLLILLARENLPCTRYPIWVIRWQDSLIYLHGEISRLMESKNMENKNQRETNGTSFLFGAQRDDV